MPDGSGIGGISHVAPPQPRRFRQRWVSPLLRRILLVNAKVPATTLAQFVQYLRSHPDQLTYSSPGNGTIGHVWGELFKHSTGTTMLHVPYKGASQALADLAA
ncbi:MAG: hypothetical protein J0H99_04975, partial [Rhodospirillales bacterium]|nr:hypothetical protein [Rhodospirillales bacterium]